MTLENLKTVSIYALLLLTSASLAAANQAGGPRVVMIVAGGISIRDIAAPEFVHLRSLLATGSAGLMNVRTGRPSREIEILGRPGMEAGCVSIGASAMGVGGAEVRRAFNKNVRIYGLTAEQLYACRTGNPAGGRKYCIRRS